MLRDKNLIPLSHQHQHALALCVRLDRALLAGPVDPEPWQAEIQQMVEQEIVIHFAVEEKEVFPAAKGDPELKSVVEELIEEHGVLRALFARAMHLTLDTAGLKAFVATLSQHIRKEERQLFEKMQQHMTADELSALGKAIERELEKVRKTCALRTSRVDGKQL